MIRYVYNCKDIINFCYSCYDIALILDGSSSKQHFPVSLARGHREHARKCQYLCAHSHQHSGQLRETQVKALFRPRTSFSTVTFENTE